MDIKLRSVKSDDYEFAFEVKKQAMGPHIKVEWGWDEEFQRNVHGTRWQEKPWFVMEYHGKDVGTISLHELD